MASTANSALFPGSTSSLVDTGEIRGAYVADSRPWVLGYSGGKDSTALLQAVYYAVARLPPEQRTKPISVVSTDTRVEVPKVVDRVQGELEMVQLAAERDGLPMTTHVLSPRLNSTFWVNLVGRGYPSPTRNFRWCTERLKIDPVSDFVRRMVSESGEVVIVLGSRRNESSSRAQAMRKHDIAGNRFRPHATMLKAWIYTPIEDLSADEVWEYLLTVPNPWGSFNEELMTLYKQANGGECPLVIDTSTPSCGNSRFGCWTCTVVDQDRAMQSLVVNGEEHLLPLLRIRDFLKKLRDEPGTRYSFRRNGAQAVRNRGTGTSEIGPFRFEIRTEILRRVLEAQKQTGETLIGADELELIQEIWLAEENNNPEKPEISTDAVARVWKSIYGDTTMPFEDHSTEDLEKEDQILEAVCKEKGVPFEMMKRLRDLEEEYGRLGRRHGLPDQMREVVCGALPTGESA